MGTRTLFHPVGLFVIRGVLERAGYRLGSLKQTKITDDQRHAQYVAQVTSKPDFIFAWHTDQIQINMNSHLAADIAVTKVWRTKTGKLMAQLETWIDGIPSQQLVLLGMGDILKLSITGGGGGGGGPDTDFTDSRGVYHSIQDQYDDAYGDEDYDDEWYEDIWYDEVLTPAQKIKRGLSIWRSRLIHRIKWILSRHYREHYGDIPF